MGKRAALGLAGGAAALAALTGLAARRHLIAHALGLTPPQYEIGVEYLLRIPMKDGVKLAADHYFPKHSGSFPTVLIRSPYGRGSNSIPLGLVQVFAARRFAERGYHVIVQDTRGRYDSEGEFVPFVHEAADGRTTLDWIGQQPWFNGAVGMWGQSYGGYVQWAVAGDAPPFLKAIVPSVAGSRLFQFEAGTYAFNTILRWVFSLNTTGHKGPTTLTEWLRTMSLPVGEQSFVPAFAHLPVSEADQLMLGRPVPYFREWLNHPRADDEYWQPMLHNAKLHNVQAPTHLLSGWYDMLLHELLSDYAALRGVGRRPYLTIGPWSHADLACVNASLKAGLEWFDTWLKDDCRNLRHTPVRVFVLGANEWRDLAAWPPPAIETRWYLHAEGALARAIQPNAAPPDTYRYDPADPTPALGGALFGPFAGAHDQRPLEARPDVLTYTSTPLEQELEVMGPVQVELYARSSLQHTDFLCRLCDVYPDGRSMNICDGLYRVEPPGGWDTHGYEANEDGILRITVPMLPTAFLFRRGHRLRLQVASGAHPHFVRNLGMGDPIGTGTLMLAADQEIFHDAAHPTALVLPVTRG